MTTTSVTSGVISSGITLNDGDELDVLYGGYADSTVVNFEGADILSAGGTADGTTINFIGTEVVSSGGYAALSIVNFGGAQVISSGGLAQATVVNSGGDVYVEDGGKAAYTITNPGGQQIVSSGGLAFSDVVGGTEFILSGGTAELATIIGGTEIVRGGSASYEIIGAGGSEVVSSGGATTSDTEESGGTLTVSANAQAIGANLMNGGQLTVLNFGNASSAVLSAGGSETVSSGGLDDGAMVLDGGYQEIASGGLASNAVIQVGGHVMIDSGGFAETENVSGGTLTVQAGAAVQSATVHKGGLLLVEGVSSQTRIEAGGTEEIDTGGVASGTTLATTGATQVVAGGTASGTTVTLGRIDVQDGGTAVGAIIALGGELVVEAGGTANGTLLSGGFLAGLLTVSAGGIALATQDTGSLEQIYGTVSNGSLSGVALLGLTATQYVQGGGLSMAQSVAALGIQVVEDGGIASATILDDLLGGAAQTVSAGGFALATVVSSGGTQTVAGNASGSLVDGGEVDVAAGGQIFATAIGLSGTVIVSAGGSADGTVVNGNAVLDVSGTTTGTTVNSGGTETVLSGGIASGSLVSATELVLSGGLTVGAMIGAGGRQTVDGGTATATQIGSGGLQFVLDGGVSVAAAIASYGLADVLAGAAETGALVASAGVVMVEDGGKTFADTIGDGAMLTVSSGGSDALSEIAAGGSATIQAGGSESFVNVDAGGTETVFGRTVGVIVDGMQTVTGVGATTAGTTVDGGDETLQGGGVASGTMVGGLGGAIDEFDGGTASGSVVSAGGNDVVHAGGIASGSTLLGGRQVVSAGGLAIGTIAGSGGHQFVEDGGTATGTQVQSGGVEVVSAGGIANGTVVDAGGTEVVSSGGVVTGSTEVAVGGTLTVAQGAVFDGTSAAVTLDAGAQLVVGDGDVLDLANIPLANHGAILLAGNSYGGGAATLRVTGSVSLFGGGTVSLYDLGGYTNAGVIVGADAGSLLDNVDNTISGWGLLGGGALSFTNEADGTVAAASQVLDLYTGRTVINRGLLEATTGTLLIEDGVDNAGTISAAGGLVRLGSSTNVAVIRGGALNSTGDGSVEVTNAAALDGSSHQLSVSARLLVDGAATLTLSGAIANSGTIQLNGNSYGGGPATLQIQGAVTLSGGGVVQLHDLGNYTNAGVITGSTAASSLDNVDNTIFGWGLLGGGALSFTNEADGVVDADTGGQTLFVDTGAGALVNHGTLEATGGTLDIAGAASNTRLILADVGGTVTLHGAITDTAGVVETLSGGTLVLDGGGIVGTGGVLVLGALDVAATGSLDGSSQNVALLGLATVEGAATLTVAGTIRNAGSLALAGNSYGGGAATLRVTGSVSLFGGGTVSLYDLGGYDNAGVIVGADAGSLLDNVDNTISGWGLLGGGALSFTNEADGTVAAASQVLDLYTGRTVINRGLLEATTGTLLIEDGVDNAGTISAAGGLVRLGSSTNVAVIRGGALNSTGDGSVEVTNAAALDGSSHQLSVSARLLVDGAATLTLSGAIANSGTIQLNGNSYGGGPATLQIQGAVTLSGGGVVQLHDLGNYTNAGVITGSTAASSLDNVDNTIFGWGLLGGGALSFTNEADGVVDADTGGQTLFVDTGAGALVNHGTLEATGGTLDIAGGLLNDGTVEEGATGQLMLGGPVGGTGTIALNGASLTLGAAIGTGQTVAFGTGRAETLVLADPGAFGGVLSGFGPADAIDVQGPTAILSYAAGTAGGPGSLVLSAGGSTVATLAITGNYTGETFLATPSADGTLVRVVPATVSATAGMLTVDPLAGSTVSLDEILSDLAYAKGGAVSTLVVNGPGAVAATTNATIADLQVVQGELRLNGQTISTDPVEIAANGTISGFGTLAGDIRDDGMLVAQGGDLHLPGAITGTGTLAVGPGADLEIGGGVSSGLTAAFQGSGRLVLDDAADFQAPITGFAAGDFVDLSGIELTQSAFSSDGINSYVTAGPVAFELADYAGPLEVDVSGGVTACYCRGTRIQTEDGETAIEDLAIGDAIRTVSGTLRAIRWIGYRSYHARFVAGRRDILPIRILAGALAAGVPRRDLDVSPLHAMYLDGLLVPAAELVNNTTIMQRSDTASVEYFHIELDSHDVIVAEGAPSESFIDDGSRMLFQNAAEFARLYPDASTVSVRFYAPRVTSGHALEGIRRSLALRAPARQQTA